MFEVFESIATILNGPLQALYRLGGSYLLAIILLTVGIKLVLHPLTRTQLKSMKAMAALAPQMEVLRRKHRDDPKQLNVEMMNLYRANKVNPFSGCLPLILQLPVLYALFALLRRPNIFGGELLFGLSLEKSPWPLEVFVQHPLLLLIPILSGVTTYLQQRMSITDPQQAKLFIFMPFMVAWFSTQFALGLSVYWIMSTILYVAEYYIVAGPPRRIGVAPPRDRRRTPKASEKARTQGQQ